MFFHTWIFAVFLAITFAGYACLKRTKFWTLWLLIASYVFYGWWNPLYLLLILYSTALDYFVGLAINRFKRKSLWLAISVVNNLLLLGFFKYGAFVAANLTSLLGYFNLGLVIPAPDVLLPVGISFYTFQSMSYSIDLYRGKIEVEKNFIRFAAFVALFPQLVAGPIERAKNLLPQLRGVAPTVTMGNVAEGLSLFMVGLFKKMAIADFLALYVDKVYGAPGEFDGVSLLVATYAFAWQIYFDFSGYTDMARGCAKAMGIDLMINFNKPYLATGLGDFWKRWHISLSSWFGDYVYIPLGGNRHGAFNTYKNMILTMLIAGLWHGAAWTFVIWGAINAVGRCLTRRMEDSRFYKDRVPTIVKRFWTFHFVCLAWVFFRADSFGDAMIVLEKIFHGVLGDPKFPVLGMILCGSVWAYQWISESRFNKVLQLSPVKVGLMFTMILYMLLFTTAGYEKFIYFQF
jgi:alginate O-acetyltransferase complex protein AlgI